VIDFSSLGRREAGEPAFAQPPIGRSPPTARRHCGMKEVLVTRTPSMR
jgi:hypothetical protein